MTGAATAGPTRPPTATTWIPTPQITVPVLIMHGEDDQVVPIENSAHKAIKLVKDGTLRTYPGLSHGLFATHPEVVNRDLLAFIRT